MSGGSLLFAFSAFYSYLNRKQRQLDPSAASQLLSGPPLVLFHVPDAGRTITTTFHPLEVVGRGSETQLQVGENLNYLIESEGLTISECQT